MSSPRYEPRKYALNPDEFGMYAGATWRAPSNNEERDRSEAARLQHMYAYVIRKKARTKFRTVRGYADACGVSYDRMTKVLRGEAIMRFEDVAQAQRILENVHEDALRVMSSWNAA